MSKFEAKLNQVKLAVIAAHVAKARFDQCHGLCVGVLCVCVGLKKEGGAAGGAAATWLWALLGQGAFLIGVMICVGGGMDQPTDAIGTRRPLTD